MSIVLVQRKRLLAAGLAVVAPIISFSMFIAAYVGSNPVNGVDPSGYFGPIVVAAIGFVLRVVTAIIFFTAIQCAIYEFRVAPFGAAPLTGITQRICALAGVLSPLGGV